MQGPLNSAPIVATICPPPPNTSSLLSEDRSSVHHHSPIEIAETRLTGVTDTACFLYPDVSRAQFTIVIALKDSESYYAMLITNEPGKEPIAFAKGREARTKDATLPGLQHVLDAEVNAISWKWHRDPVANDEGGLVAASKWREAPQPPAYEDISTPAHTPSRMVPDERSRQDRSSRGLYYGSPQPEPLLAMQRRVLQAQLR